MSADEYKLKIDIDEKEFARKIKAALKGIGIGGMGGGEGRGGGRGGGTWYGASEKAYAKKMAADVKAHAEKATNRANESIRSEAGRTLHRIGGVYTQMGRAMGGQRGAAVGRSIEMIAGLFGKTGVKGSKLPQLVKIAGFMAGAAGIAGLGKAIIDSSPLLKAMMEIMNMIVTLFLMPIGTFIGFFIKPLVFMALKWVIPWFKRGMALSSTGERVAEGFNKDPITNIKDFLNFIYEQNTGKKVDQTKEQGKSLWQQFIDALFRAGPKFMFLGPGGGGDSGGGTGEETPQQKAADDLIDIFMEDFPEIGKQWAINLKEEMGLSDSLSKKHIPAETEGQRILRMYKEAIESGSVGHGKNVEAREASKKREKELAEAGLKTIEESNKELTGILEGWGLTREQVDNMKNEQGKIIFNMQAVKNALAQTAETFAAMGFGFASTEGDSGSLSGFAATYEAAKGAMGFYGSSGSFGSASQGQKLYSSAAQAKANSPAPTVKKAASKSGQHGGILMEPLVGFGLRSGTRYNLGESGPEAVVPLGGSGLASRMRGGGGDNFTFNINVTGTNNASEIADKLRPIIMRIIRDETSRRGKI